MLSRVPVTAMRPQQDLKSFLPEMMFNIAFPVFKKNIFLNYFLKVNILLPLFHVYKVVDSWLGTMVLTLTPSEALKLYCG